MFVQSLLPSDTSVRIASPRDPIQTQIQPPISLCILDGRLRATWLRRAAAHEVSQVELALGAELERLARAVLDSGNEIRRLLPVPDANGTRVLDLTLFPVKASDGETTSVIASVLDAAGPVERAEGYRLLADYTFDWEYWIDADDRLRWISPSCERVTGHGVEAFLADPGLLESLVVPEDRALFASHPHWDDGCGSTQSRFRIVRSNGEIRWIEHLCRPMYWPDGGFAGHRAINRDITETMRVEQALRESENQFRLIFELATVGMAVVEPRTRRLLRVNERLCRILGYDADELLQKSFQELTHPDDRKHDLERFRRAVQRLDTDYFTEKRYVRKDGQVVWALVNATFIRDELGYPVRALAAIIDITDRREAEARARDLAAIVECSSDFIGIAGLDGRGSYLNQAGRALVGIEGEPGVESSRIEDFFLPEDRPFVRETIMPTLEATGRWAGEFRFRHFPTGEPIDVFYDALRIDDPDSGRPLHYATVTRDIRKEKAAEQALREADRRKDEFLAVLGHELRNPMAPIRNAVEIIRAIGIGEDPRIAWAIDVLDRQTAHMGRLLEDLLDVSRIVQGRIDLVWSEVQVRDLVQQAVDGVRALMRARGHRFSCAFPASDVMVEGDSVRLSQILLNILVNAAKYTPEGGEIRLDTELDAGLVLIRVRDNGQGMSADQIDSLFGLYSQGVNNSDAPGGGLGLGLAIARRLAELHGGSLEAVSEGVGRGAELKLRLPVLARAPGFKASGAPRGPDRPSKGEPLRVLVVDDNPDVAGALAMLLEILGYGVATAMSGPEALEAVRRHRPRIAFLDIGIPGIDGLELARRLRKDYPDSRQLMLVALTGLGHEQARERSLAAGFDEHLVKPLEQRVLLALLDRLAT
ncbi:PAS domain S-box protein [Thiocystis violacea]|uniref:hybrid sensor histidine kinase/response regulator n=1 Tax=Thiocystis violacea TaxID=13725 RepID=UPI001907285D|nr:PAS domain S-box protein [Thiocystis violacea]MBK1719679.1 hybrid sensor histidine kinase/response regulator [Thiocystis violacea]